MKTILCFGDSNTYGEIAGGGRYGRNERWTGRLQQLLGSDYYVIEEGCGGRTTVWDDPIEEYKNGKQYLIPCLNSHKPLDLVILMLGTNDFKNRFSLSAKDISLAIENLINEIKNSSYGLNDIPPHILLLSPPEITKLSELSDILMGANDKREKLAVLLEDIARKHSISFLDTAPITSIDPIDGVHLDLNGHKTISNVVADIVITILK